MDDTGARHAGRNQTCTQIGDDRDAWTTRAAGLHIVATTGSAVDPLRIATEGALWGGPAALGRDTVSDGAGQFAVGSHARC